MYRAYKHLVLLAVCGFSASLLCQDGQEKIDPSCRDNTSQNTNPFAPDFNPDTYETLILESIGNPFDSAESTEKEDREKIDLSCRNHDTENCANEITHFLLTRDRSKTTPMI